MQSNAGDDRHTTTKSRSLSNWVIEQSRDGTYFHPKSDIDVVLSVP